jgi:hypothetical protein
MSETIDYLQDEGVTIDRLWIDIRWKRNSPIEINKEFLNEIIRSLEQFNMKFGILTTKSQWNIIMNSTEQYVGKCPLWYSNFDNRQSFDDFQVFGGWKQPSIKQYLGDAKECGVVLNRNYASII